MSEQLTEALKTRKKTKRRNDEAGKLLELLRNRSGLSRVGLAKTLGISYSLLTALENGNRNLKKPLISETIAALGLGLKDHNSLLIAAGYETIDEKTDVGLEHLKRDLGNLSEEHDRMLFIRAINKYAAHWLTLRRSRASAVETAVIVCAGWQGRILSLEQLTVSITHALEEAKKAKIREFVIVVPPNVIAHSNRVARSEGRANVGGDLEAAKLAKALGEELFIDSVRERYGKIYVVVQNQPLGLGDAILRTRPILEDRGPFSVILPVDVDENGCAIGELKRAYEGTRGKNDGLRKPLVAVTSPDLRWQAEVKRYGLVELAEAPMPGSDGRISEIRRLQEKVFEPDLVGNTTKIIIGRYILTTDIFPVLEELSAKQGRAASMKANALPFLELTDALEDFRGPKHHHLVYAYDLGRAMLPLAPVRAFIELLLGSVGNPAEFKRLIGEVRNLLSSGTVR